LPLLAEVCKGRFGYEDYLFEVEHLRELGVEHLDQILEEDLNDRLEEFVEGKKLGLEWRKGACAGAFGRHEEALIGQFYEY